jgi:heat-inducible transcriptional repressor
MAGLEDMGFLDKPHTSAGRTPSDLAYRLYVDRLIHIGALTKEDTQFIKTYFDKRVSEISQVLDTAARALSDATNHIALVSGPQMDKTTVRRIQLVKITDTKAMLIIVTFGGLVEDTVIPVPVMLDSSHMEHLSNMLTEATKDMPMEKAARLVEEASRIAMKDQQDVLNKVFEAINVNRGKREMILEGAQNIFRYPEYKNIDKAQHFMELLDTKESLYSLLDSAADVEFSLRIGRENENEDFNDMSVVTATYKVGGKNIGSFGVLGPTRMDYARVLAVLNYVSLSLNEILSCFLEEDE